MRKKRRIFGRSISNPRCWTSLKGSTQIRSKRHSAVRKKRLQPLKLISNSFQKDQKKSCSKSKKKPRKTTAKPQIIAETLIRWRSDAPAVAAAKRELERFLFTRVYRSERVLAVRVPAQQRLAEMFDWYAAHPEQLPPRFHERAAAFGVRRSTADYIAGMTDRFLEADHGRCFSD